MRRLLDDFGSLFDLDHSIAGTTLGGLLERAVSGLESSRAEEWGSRGRREQLASRSGGLVSFYYRPHLFPGMELKLRLAHELQFRLLPRSLSEAAPFSVAAVLESYCHLSGDLFGWQQLRDRRFLIWIVDIAGHGVRSGLASAVLRILVDNLCERGRVDLLVSELNGHLCRAIRPEHDGLFATAFFAVVDDDGYAAYCSAAHPPMLLRRVDGNVEELESLGRPLGLFADSAYRAREFRLRVGDALLLYTDGLVEMTGTDGRPFGLDRVRDHVRASDGDPEQLTREIYRDVASRHDIDQLDDDVTFLAARLRG
jgi:sigma-B regulation protein RsbU (phosphoserine phosphatase)